VRVSRSLVALAAAIAVLDSILIAALPPLLPHYADEFGIGASLAGVLSASYSIGLLLGALPAGQLVGRLGQRPVIVISLVVLAVSSVGFGLASSFALLVTARTIEGIASAFAWTAMFAWLTAEAPPARRARLFGLVLGAAFVGFTLGPALGALAVGIGTAPTFMAFGAVAAIVAAVTFLLPSPVRPPRRPLRAYALLARSPGVPYSLWLQAFPGLLIGAIGLIAALRLADLGLGTAWIAAVFTVGSALQAVSSPLAGRWTERSGVIAPIRFGLLSSAALTVCIAIPTHVGVLAAIAALALGVFAMMLTPATAALTTAVERAGEDPSLGFALMNFAFAPGAIAGAVLAGVMRETVGDTAALAVIAGACLATAMIPERVVPSDEPAYPSSSGG
jgi:predicted MFS family arabinose efflux permease